MKYSKCLSVSFEFPEQPNNISLLSSEDFFELLKTDGRITGFLAEEWINYVFPELEQQGKGERYDFVDPRNGEKIECKIIKGKTLSPIPSGMKGMGRKYDPDKYLQHLSTLDHYIVVDVSELPKVKMFTIPVTSGMFFDEFGDIKRSIRRESLEFSTKDFTKLEIPIV